MKDMMHLDVRDEELYKLYHPRFLEWIHYLHPTKINFILDL
jgi:hypothetical protein